MHTQRIRVQHTVSLPGTWPDEHDTWSFRQFGWAAPEQSAPAVQIDVAGNDVHPAHAEQSAPKPGQSPPPATTGIEHCIVQYAIKSSTHWHAGAHESTEQLEFAYEPEREPLLHERVWLEQLLPQGNVYITKLKRI